MTKVTQAVGAWGERLAAAHLLAAGMVLLDRNWRGAAGEIDIIARDGDAVVFCEVKTRRSATYGTPAEAVARAKVRRLRQLAAQWLAITGVRPSEVRFDVVSVYARRGAEPVVQHIRGAF
ncbi:YraN family protein [Catellatospora bangladeshensis]|uniref:YraN family protein n=1 Tax=Catellatospora bangladeshensis TaxID=310355 RepID=UPI0019459B0E|nr:YraN family protein [Catellatospora bangladeshensis]